MIETQQVENLQGVLAHHPLCDWHYEQYWFECTCGATQPKAEYFDEYVAKCEASQTQNSTQVSETTGVTMTPRLRCASSIAQANLHIESAIEEEADLERRKILKEAHIILKNYLNSLVESARPDFYK